jgi:hypothetical protein
MFSHRLTVVWDNLAALATFSVVSKEVNRKHKDHNTMDEDHNTLGEDHNMMDEDNNMMNKDCNTVYDKDDVCGGKTGDRSLGIMLNHSMQSRD